MKIDEIREFAEDEKTLSLERFKIHSDERFELHEKAKDCFCRFSSAIARYIPKTHRVPVGDQYIGNGYYSSQGSIVSDRSLSISESIMRSSSNLRYRSSSRYLLWSIHSVILRMLYLNYGASKITINTYFSDYVSPNSARLIEGCSSLMRKNWK